MTSSSNGHVSGLGRRAGRITRKEGWQAKVQPTLGEPPLVVSAREFALMGEVEKQDYADLRTVYARGLVPIPALYADIHAVMWRQFLMNDPDKPTARRGIALDGEPSNGKSTALIEFGRAVERDLRRKFPEQFTAAGHEFLPVVYVNISAKPSIKGLNEALIGFYQDVPQRQMTTERLTQLVLNLAESCDTRLFLIDEVHMLQLHRDSDIETNNHLKHLANETGATFMYAGVGLEEEGFFTEGKGKAEASRSQIRQRFTCVPVKPLGFGSKEEQDLFIGTLKHFENKLLLVDSEPEDLTSEADYIFARTQGVIGSIEHLLMSAHFDAIHSGREKFDRTVFEGIDGGGLLSL